MPIASTDIGYVALLTMLVILPAAAVAAAVLDRMMWRRREHLLRKPLSAANAFPVIPTPQPAPLPAISIEPQDVREE